MNLKKLITKITAKNRLYRLFFMFIGVFLLALNYNLFFVRYELVTGGVSGISIVFNKLFGWNNQIFIYVANLLLLIISYFTVGKAKTRRAALGSILYPIMITLTVPLSNFLAPYFTFDDFIITLAFTSILFGFANGLIYKMGYNTGGSDIIMDIMVKYLHMPEGRANVISSVVIILLAGITLGVTKIVYAIIITYVLGIIVDRMMIGISKKKLFIIDSAKIDEIEKVIMNDLKLGVTILKAKGGFSNQDKEVLMCAVPTKNYYMFKELILEIDANAFLIINDCYDLEGGTFKQDGFSLDDILS